MHTAYIIIGDNRPGTIAFAGSISVSVLIDFEFFKDNMFDSSKYDECHDWMLDKSEDCMSGGEDLAIVTGNVSPDAFIELANKYSYTVYVIRLV